MLTNSSMHKTRFHMLIMVPHSTDLYTKKPATFHYFISSFMLKSNSVKQMKHNPVFIDWRNLNFKNQELILENGWKQTTIKT